MMRITSSNKKHIPPIVKAADNGKTTLDDVEVLGAFSTVVSPWFATLSMEASL